MSDSAVADIVLIGGIAALGYVVYQALQPVEAAAANVGAAVNDTEQGIANAWVWATSSSIVPTGNVILPNGTTVPVSSLVITSDASTGAAEFVYDSEGYSIVPNPSGGPAYDSDGNYHAQVDTDEDFGVSDPDSAFT